MIEPNPVRAACADFYSAPIPVGEQYLILSERTGHLGVINGDMGYISRRIELYDLSKTELSNESTLSRAILGVQPTEYGTLIIARRRIQDLRENQKYLVLLVEETRLSQTEQAIIKIERANAYLNKHGKIILEELDPETGKISKASPIGAIETIDSMNQLNKFKFTLDVRGRVIGSWVN